MLFAVDVGNTNITCAAMNGLEVVCSFRMTTKIPRTSDEYGALISEMLKEKKVKKSDIDSVIIASVVPGVMHSLSNGIVKYLDKKPLVVGEGTKSGIKIITPNPKEVGADRIVDAVGAYELYGGPVIVCDFGTATTYDLITKDAVFAAAVTSPGLRMCANALWTDTARLPEIEIEKPKSILATETITSMQAGLVYGYIGQTEYIVKKMKEESGLTDAKVVATGGLGRLISDSTDEIDVYDPDLTMKGLSLIYDKTVGSKKSK